MNSLLCIYCMCVLNLPLYNYESSLLGALGCYCGYEKVFGSWRKTELNFQTEHLWKSCDVSLLFCIFQNNKFKTALFGDAVEKFFSGHWAFIFKNICAVRSMAGNLQILYVYWIVMMKIRVLFVVMLQIEAKCTNLSCECQKNEWLMNLV
jgi:hypothetical protein